MKKMKSRLRSQKGESIAEVLIAVLLSAVALTMLASMISATSKMVIRSRNLTKEYVQQNNLLVEKGAPTRTGSVEVRLLDAQSNAWSPIKLYDDGNDSSSDDGGSETTAISVQYYINSRVGNVSVTSYKKGGTS